MSIRSSYKLWCPTVPCTCHVLDYQLDLVLPLSALLLSTLKLVILNILLGREPQLKLILMYVQRLHNIAHGLLDGNQFWKLRNQ